MTYWNRRSFLRTTAQAAALTALPTLRSADALGPKTSPTFPKDFFWGASTSSVQVEGSPAADGAGRSVFDVYESKPGNIKDGSTHAVTDDEYHRFPEDIAHMREIGLNAYRFSISWTRVIPGGKGQANEAGLAYYDRVIDVLLAAKITPFVTIFHFDYPEALQQIGGWLNPDSSKWLADYSYLVASRYSDRVANWLTINEPNIFWGFGAEAGGSPLGLKLNNAELAQGAHNLLLGHGRSVQAIRAAAKKPVKVGMPYAGMFSLPASSSPEDVAAARTASFAVEKRVIIPNQPALTMLNNAWWLDPIYLGHYPADSNRLFPTVERLATPADMSVIHQPLDYCAINLYFADTVRAGPGGKPEIVPDAPNTPRAHTGWPVTPEVLYWAPKFLAERYKKPIVVTENGFSFPDIPSPDGKVHDPQRIAFLNGYLGAYKRAHCDGVPLIGYFHWSLLDNWEFGQGFLEQFGFIYVDKQTQRRTLKDSAYRYKQIIATGGADL